MALYAFDGTCNEDGPHPEEITNVKKFYDAYKSVYHVDNSKKGKCVYIEGVGTRFFLLGKVLGGGFGVGGLQRVSEAYDELDKNFEAGDEEIDIIGFSRGAALAVTFAHRIHKHGVEVEGKGLLHPNIRFLGLWDTVASFGIPGNDINLGYHLQVPENVEKTCHALSLDERRFTFPLTRMSENARDARQERKIFEVWFRGFHSDVGGGNNNEGLSSIPLNWMFLRAVDCGIRIPQSFINRNQALMNPDTPPKKPGMELIENDTRPIGRKDVVHHTVKKIPGGKRWAPNNPPDGLKVVDDRGNILEQPFS